MITKNQQKVSTKKPSINSIPLGIHFFFVELISLALNYTQRLAKFQNNVNGIISIHRKQKKN